MFILDAKKQKTDRKTRVMIGQRLEMIHDIFNEDIEELTASHLLTFSYKLINNLASAAI